MAMTRFKMYWQILALPTWRWLIALPFGILGAAAFVRDELLEPDLQSKYKLFKLLPNISWGWYLLVIALIVIIIIMESAFQALKKFDTELEQLVDSYAHSLNLQRVDYEEFRQLNGNREILNRSARFALRLHNTHDKPIKYEVTRIAIDDQVQTNFTTRGATMSPHSDTSFFSERMPISGELGNPLQVRMSLEILYGPADQKPTRKITKTLNLEVFTLSGQVNMQYIVDHDVPL